MSAWSERFSLLSKSLAMDGGPNVLSFKNGKPVTGDEYNAKNAIFTVSEAMEHFAYLPTGLYVLRIKDVFCGLYMIIFFAALVQWYGYQLPLSGTQSD
ncbi:hypothetical protein ACNKHL_04620 [Shigella flexneri]